ncbi:hypothetical protein [Xanthomonas translucens]|uniref:hypothetical protein n=1 Tax=Xanthomonas campestris pv. translucens TaxID=343 RepID=UPI001F410EB4|nr:hypothetical protein [Xanthomonas translucens]UJB17160.1 hypothetical protein LTC53_11535 [Xanthomonas translucens pv. undulosa]
MRDTPSASAANITARCETDLSPGIFNVPRKAEPFVAIQYCSLLITIPEIASHPSGGPAVAVDLAAAIDLAVACVVAAAVAVRFE